jgi:hypothetical protein
MAKSGKALPLIALIIAISGLLVGGYAAVQISLRQNYVLPVARVFLGGDYDLSSGMPYKLLDFTDKSFDSHNAFDLTSDAYIVPEAGYYQITAQYSIFSYDQDFFMIGIWQNETTVGVCSYFAAGSTNTFTVSITDIIFANVGDAISIFGYIYNTLDNPRTLFAGEGHTFFSIAKLSQS